MKKLPAGIFYDGRRESPRKYRVRLYKNGKAHLGGYFETQPEAHLALAALKLVLEKTPKKMGEVHPAWNPSTKFADVANAARNKQ